MKIVPVNSQYTTHTLPHARKVVSTISYVF